jgi:HPt (histidine-containing phosphotransfer) domain-containing protein
MAIDRRPIEQMIVDVGPEAFRRLAALFQDETVGSVADMRGLLAAQDWRELGRIAHSLKHATASFGLTALADEALVLERAADAADAAASEKSLAALSESCAETIAEFNELIEEFGEVE